MEDYETFCKKHLSRIQEEATKGENSSTSLDRNVSLIQFHGVPVLSPLVSRCLFPPRRVNCAVGFDVCTDCPEGAAPFELFWPLLTALWASLALILRAKGVILFFAMPVCFHFLVFTVFVRRLKMSAVLNWWMSLLCLALCNTTLTLQALNNTWVCLKAKNVIVGIVNTEVVKRLQLKLLFLHVFAISRNTFHKLIRYIKLFCT